MEKDVKRGRGRKPIGIQPKEQVAFRLDSRVVEVIKSQPNQSVFIETAVLEKNNRDQSLEKNNRDQSLPK